MCNGLFMFNMMQVDWSKKDGDYIHKGLQFGRVSGRYTMLILALYKYTDF